MRFHGGVRDLIGNEPSFRHIVRFCKSLFRLAKNVVVILFDVVRLAIVDQVSLRPHRLFRIEVSGQNLIIHVD